MGKILERHGSELKSMVCETCQLGFWVETVDRTTRHQGSRLGIHGCTRNLVDSESQIGQSISEIHYAACR